MTPEETLVLTRYVKACCPQQAIDTYTPDAWHDLLDDLELDDCRAAVAAVAKRQPFVAPAEIRAEVKRIRDARIAAAIVPAPPAELTDEPGRYNELIRANVRRIADAKNVRRALAAGPLPGDPPQEWLDAKAALAKPPEPAADPRQKAREQVEELRRAREAGESA
jgi:hypothetical protein